MRALALALLAAPLAGCALLDAPVYEQGPVGADGLPGEATAKVDPDGTQHTVGEAAADVVDESAPAIVGTLSSLLPPQYQPLAALLGASGLAAGAAALRGRHKGAKAPATSEPS